MTETSAMAETSKHHHHNGTTSSLAESTVEADQQITLIESQIKQDETNIKTEKSKL